MSRWAGLGRRSPLVAGVFALLLFAFAGIPLTSGFTGKFVVFGAAAAGGAVPVVDRRRDQQRDRRVLLRPGDRADVLLRPAGRRPHRGHPERPTTATIAVATAVTILLGILPQPMLDLAERASEFVG